MQSGTYTIYNVSFSKQVIDLSGGGAIDGTPVIGYNYDTSINENQRWTVQVLAKEGDNQATVRLINNGTGTYMRAEPETLGAGVVGSHVATKWTLVKLEMGHYMIKGQQGELVCSLKNGGNSTQITLAALDDSDNRQLWTFNEE
ncbi:ricin B lectin domain-containing protein [Suillus subalutaceus]|uniref:ricin B lectin domain-containing protein n=1 Tax=Suillus subalutaceus TaxID=48586 RepID=UPI001B85C063|nr:ricin B lectin domain-containing protein [Suillus subalutaceus]KAG1867259.1 ricin B lectin domain-containing protein [Suillus subalutaceus]